GHEHQEHVITALARLAEYCRTLQNLFAWVSRDMALTLQLTNDLSSGSVYLFADWPNIAVPTFGAGVYTIWHSDGRFIYVGMSGRGMTTDTIRRNRPQGIYT